VRKIKLKTFVRTIIKDLGYSISDEEFNTIIIGNFENLYFTIHDVEEKSLIWCSKSDFTLERSSIKMEFDYGESVYENGFHSSRGILRFILEIGETHISLLYRPYYHHGDIIEKQVIHHKIALSTNRIKEIKLNLLLNEGTKYGKIYEIDDKMSDPQDTENYIYELVNELVKN